MALIASYCCPGFHFVTELSDLGPGLGQDGDVAIVCDTTATPPTVYYSGPKTGGAWPTPKSLTGMQGADGADGADGMDGADGPQGPQGIQGVPGVDGVDGVNGVDGVDGVDGATGPEGPEGPQGIQGIQGIPGVDGIDGTDGAQGPQGDPGPQGIQGLPGIDGMDGVGNYTVTDLTELTTLLNDPLTVLPALVCVEDDGTGEQALRFYIDATTFKEIPLAQVEPQIFLQEHTCQIALLSPPIVDGTGTSGGNTGSGVFGTSLVPQASYTTAVGLEVYAVGFQVANSDGTPVIDLTITNIDTGQVAKAEGVTLAAVGLGIQNILLDQKLTASGGDTLHVQVDVISGNAFNWRNSDTNGVWNWLIPGTINHPGLDLLSATPYDVKEYADCDGNNTVFHYFDTSVDPSPVTKAATLPAEFELFETKPTVATLADQVTKLSGSSYSVTNLTEIANLLGDPETEFPLTVCNEETGELRFYADASADPKCLALLGPSSVTLEFVQQTLSNANAGITLNQWNVGANFFITDQVFHVSEDPAVPGVQGATVTIQDGETKTLYLVGPATNQAGTFEPNLNGQISGVQYEITNTDGVLSYVYVERAIQGGLYSSTAQAYTANTVTAYDDLTVITGLPGGLPSDLENGATVTVQEKTVATGFLAAYADDTEALAAGLVQGQQYVDPSGFVRQVL